MNGSQLIQYLRSVSFLDDYNSTFSFDSSHDGSAWYDILRYNATSGCWNKIGEYTEANGLGKVQSIFSLLIYCFFPVCCDTKTKNKTLKLGIGFCFR